jgi:hypothetical protein
MLARSPSSASEFEDRALDVAVMTDAAAGFPGGQAM